jgi:hypothetical protein
MHLLAQDSILFLQIVDDIVLLSVDPTSKEQQQELRRLAWHVEAAQGCHYRASWRDSFQSTERKALTSWPFLSILFQHMTPTSSGAQ